MQISLNNSLTRSKIPFEPIDPQNVRMYVCGPTVYDRAHIGNARAVVVFDVLYRILRHKYKNNITYVRNITDVDDKINAAAKAQGIDISELTTKTTEAFHSDMAALNCLSPTHEPRATQHIPQMIEMIGRLIVNGNAYEAEGHVLFRVSSDPKYGHLSGRSLEEMVAGSRVEVAPYKESPMDFVLWKPSSQDEPGWDSPWGRGRPGWHIECSAMSVEYLGETFDIHGGGADLTFPHHENEIAQSCCANPGSKYTNYWVHNGFLTVDGEKMSKSLGNFVTVKDLLDKGVRGEVIRYALLATHYKKPLDWTDKAVSDAEKALDGFYNAIKKMDEYISTNPSFSEKSSMHTEDATSPIIDDFKKSFYKALYDDLNTPLAISLIHQFSTKYTGLRRLYTETLRDACNILGLLQYTPEEWFASTSAIDDSLKQKIESLIVLRKEARAAKNWAESDRIRDELLAMGIIVEDKQGGVMEWRVK